VTTQIKGIDPVSLDSKNIACKEHETDSDLGYLYIAGSTTDGQELHVLAHAKDEETGNIAELKSHHEHLVVADYIDMIGIGIVSGHSEFRARGRREGLATGATGDDIGQITAVNISYPDQTNGEQLSITSANANDTAAGTGVQEVTIHYLDNTGAEQSEVLATNGGTANMVATNVRFVNYFHSSGNGTFGGTAAGDITLHRTGDAARVYNVIKAGTNVSLESHRMVPLGKNFYMTYVHATAATNKPISVRLRATADYEGNLTTGTFIFDEIFELQDSAGNPPQFSPPKKFPALTIIKGTAYSTQAGGSCAISYGGWVE